MVWLGASWVVIFGLIQSAALLLLLNLVHNPFEKIVISLLALILYSISSSSRGISQGLAAMALKIEEGDDEEENESNRKLLNKSLALSWLSGITSGIFYLIAVGQLVLVIIA
jgi:hypothetical protein